MAHSRQYRWLIAVGIGLVGGLILSGLWPNTPLYAVATDRVETFAMATGPVDTESRPSTSSISSPAISRPWCWGNSRHVDRLLPRQRLRRSGHRPAEEPQVSDGHGLVALRRGGGSRQQPSSAMCYVAEVTSGKVAAYAIPGRPRCMPPASCRAGSCVRSASPASAKSPARAPPPCPAPCNARRAKGRQSSSNRRRRTQATMQVTVNGQSRQVADGATSRRIVGRIAAGGKPVAVEVNLELVPRQRHAQHRLAEGDRLEIVTLVGGG